MNMTKALLEEELLKTQIELEAAKELLAAIVAAANVPTPKGDNEGRWQFTMMDRLIAIGCHAKHAENAAECRIGTGRLQALVDKPLTYVPYPDSELDEDTA